MSPKFVAQVCAALLLVGCGEDEPGSSVEDLTQTVEPNTEIGEDEIWVIMQSHLHTTGQHDCANNPVDPGPLPDGECYSADGIKAFLEQALAYGASDMLITDHNSVGSWFDPAFAPMASEDGSRYATPLRGEEWSSGGGHMTLFFPRQVVESNQQAIDEGLIWAAGNHSDDPDPQDYIDTVDRVHERGGLAIVNHPELLIHGFDEAAYGADGVEVGVKLSLFQASSDTRMWWHRRLTEGDRLTGLAGSDHHHGGGDLPFLKSPIFGTAINLMRVDPSLPNYDSAADAIADPSGTIDMRSDIAADAIRRGHVQVIEDLDTPRVYLGADLDGDGLYHDARGGDCIPPDAISGDHVTVRVRITHTTSQKGHYNVLFFNEKSSSKHWFYVELEPEGGFEEDDHYEIDPNDPYSIVMRVPVDPSSPGFLRIEVEDDVFGPYNDTKTLSNPIYFGDWGDECTGSARMR